LPQYLKSNYYSAVGSYKKNQKPFSGNLIIGRQPVIEAIESGKQIDKIFFQQNVSGDSIGRIRQLASGLHIPIQQVPVEKLNGLSKANHQGVIAIASLVHYTPLQDVIDALNDKGEMPFFLMLDGITDVRNIGGIARSAVCCGVQAIIIPDKGVGAINEEAIKSSAGALHKIYICRVGSLLKAVDELHLNGIKVYSSALNTEKALEDIDFNTPCCIVCGNEEKGVQPFLIKASDETFTIPMTGDFDSFNVSVATGIICYEGMKQRRKM
jgi:23S rRNA (guanosine2251-2'-O)-methyltransferase